MKYYYPLSLFFIISLIISNLAAIKVCSVFGFILPAAIIIFPLLYILNDILTEVYGFSASRRVVWTALLYNFLVSIFLYLVIYLPPSPFWQDQAAFEQIYSLSPRIFFASITSYLIGELINAWVISLLKLKFQGQYYPLRALASTAIGSIIESLIFCYIGFFKVLPVEQLIKMAFTITSIKIIYELAVMPISYRLVKFLKKAEGIDSFERPSLKGIIFKVDSN